MTRIKRLPLFCLVLLASSAASLADEQVRRVQEELRKRNLYFGDIDGTKGKEITGAIRRYQDKKGFAATGDLDLDTLRSLNLAAPLKSAAAWPDGIVLKSDLAREVTESDRKMLESLEAADPPAAIAEAPPPQPPAPDPASPEIAPVKEGTEEFIRSYLAACETNKLDDEMAFYTERLDYFDSGLVSRDFVRKDVQRYYKHWPQRKYELLDFKLSKATPAEFVVQFQIAFHYKNSARAFAGRTTNVYKIQRNAGEMRIVSVKEQRVRE